MKNRYWVTTSLLVLCVLFLNYLPACAENVNHVNLPAPIAPINGRLSMAITFPGDGSQLDVDGFRRSYTTAKNLGVSLCTLYYMWSELESSQGNYSWGDLDFPMQLLAEQQLRVSFILKIIDTSQLGTYPKDLRFRTFDEPGFVRRLTRFVETLLARYPSQINYLWIGNEIDDYFVSHRDAIPAYKNLLSEVVRAVHAKYPGVKIGTISTYHDAKMQKALDVIEQTGTVGDIVGFSFYPQSISGATPTTTEPYMQDMIAIAKRIRKPFLITETAWSAEGLGGSDAHQVEYLRDLFRIYRRYKDQMDVLGLFVLYDFPGSVNQDLAAQAGIQGQEDFVRFTGSLGYAKNDGTPRPAWSALQEELKKLK